MIQKIIWQTHDYKYDEIPKHLKKCMMSWKMANPDWDYRYIDYNYREMFIKARYPKLYDLYTRKRKIFQADIWRIVIVYEFGGIYVDMDSWCDEPLSYMLEKNKADGLITQSYVNKPNEELHVNNALFGAPAKCQSLLNMINEIIIKYEEINFINNKESVPNLNNIDIHDIFSKEAVKNYNPLFTAGLHGKNFKYGWGDFTNQDFNYYGQIMKYSEYLKNILKLDDQTISELT